MFYFFQRYSGRYDGWHVPLAYVLMTDKSENSYDEVLSALQQVEPRLNPTDFVVDFEKAAINAINRTFPMAEVHGCFFHFGQSVYRHVQQVGLQSIYSSDADFAQNIKLLMALAFVPPDSVVDAYDELISIDFFDENNDSPHKDQIQALLLYFQTTYIYRLARTGVRKPPLFPPTMWNVFEQTLTGNLLKIFSIYFTLFLFLCIQIFIPIILVVLIYTTF